MGASIRSVEPDRVELSRAFRAEMSAEERSRARDLEERDREVRAHEEAHKRAGGQYVQGGPSFHYEVGPDGQRYAVGGEVQIDVSPVRGDPEATIRKMQQVRRAALAPADPSEQDRQVAAQAMAVERQARAEVTQQRFEERRTEVGHGGASFVAADQRSNATVRQRAPVSFGEAGVGARGRCCSMEHRYAGLISIGRHLDIAG
ncbi:MAG: hypothetical protein JSU68_07040 [Phycisphaerales bacterium]|nr:MAG: hypothetical protein JSU68_07040 [Phycisphaerales bacterium]